MEHEVVADYLKEHNNWGKDVYMCEANVGVYDIHYICYLRYHVAN